MQAFIHTILVEPPVIRLKNRYNWDLHRGLVLEDSLSVPAAPHEFQHLGTLRRQRFAASAHLFGLRGAPRAQVKFRRLQDQQSTKKLSLQRSTFRHFAEK